MLDSVLFDLDGLLIDSEPLQFRAYRQAFAEFDVTLDRAGWARWHAVEASSARWIRDQGLDLDAVAVRARKKEIYDLLIAEELQLKPGARALVEACAAEYRLAIVSGSRRESIVACLQKFDLDKHFKIYVSGSDMTRSKPYPDAYLDALRRLETSAARSIALEDSLSGYRAALAAELACVVCPDDFRLTPRDSFDQAALVVESLHELDPAILRALL